MAGPDRSEPLAGSSRHQEYKVQPPRPPNAWILYRSNKFALMREKNERMPQGLVSQMVASMWKNEDEDVRRYWERVAENEKARHQELYPGYRYCPRKKEEKEREKEDRKQSRLAKKSKARDAIPPSDTNASHTLPAPPLVHQSPADTNANPTVPVLPPGSYIPQPYLVPGYNSNMVLSQSYMMPYLPEARYGPCGPSPPISAAPSPVPSPEMQPRSVSSSSSSPSTLLSPSSESQASSSSSLLSANQFYRSSLPSSQDPSPNPYATQPLPTLLFQASAPLAGNTVTPAAPVWNTIPNQLPSFDFHNSEVINFNIPVNQIQNFAEFQQSVPGSSLFDPLHGQLSRTDENGVFSLSNVGTSNLLSRPQGELEVAMGSQASTVDYNEKLFADFDFAEFEQQMASLAEANSSAASVASSVRGDLQSLFQTPNNPEVQAYTAARQRQPSVFTQDMMNFLNFEAAEGSTEDTSSTVSSAPVPTTVAPQQVRLQSPQHPAPMPIFTQMTNTPTVPSSTSYVPPAGAIYSSTRRVAASWKPPFPTPPQVEEPVQCWTLYTN